MASLADVGWKLLEFKARSKRSSIYEPLKLSNLQREDEPLWEKLDRYYSAKTTILNYQSPNTGLFPVKTCSTCKEAKVRDSLYCAAGAWALAMAYRIDDDMGRTHELEHSAIKCMRGILYCYMRQADKVEQFKQDPSPSKCLHSVFNVDTGDEVYTYGDYHHLQIDAVSLFLLYLVEMICSGLQIIYNTDEVSFIQNLVFCVERAYRVPDYGMWERGSKYNNGSTELHSSVGLAKAALEAINGFNLFGNQGCSWSVIFVDLDAHNRNRQTLCSLLPRESRSHLQNTDAALLPTISYPAFAVDDDALYSQTLDKIVRKLRGKYGFKRFLRDGYRTTNEDKERRYYKPAEMKLFDGIECEFPIFFIYMMIDVFRGNKAQVKEYQELLEPIIFQSYEGHAVIPKYYYVPADFVEAEQSKHGSQKRFPSNSGRDGKVFLWGQALYNIAKLLDELISPKDIDPVHRYVPHRDQRNVSMRYSNQGPIENDVVIHVSLIAESQLQVFLNTYGIQTQTPQQVEPIQIWPQKELVKAYRFLAINKKLGLSGRPERPVGCIGTCKNALQFIKQCWKMQGRPLFLVLIREDNIGSRFNPVLDMLASFKKGSIGGVKVHVDRLQTLISGAVVEQLDFLRVNEARISEFKSFEELEMPKHSKVKRQTSTPNASDLEQQPEISEEEWLHKPTQEIIQKFHDSNCLASQAQLAGILLRREGPDFLAKDNLMEELERIYRQAGSRKLSVVRLAASLLTKLVDSLAPSITSVLVHGKQQVTLGLFGHEEEVISNPLSPGVIQGIIYNKCSPQGGEREAVLQQELVIHIGWIISNNPELFSGMIKIRIRWIVQAMKHELKIRAGDMPPQDIYQLSPSDIKQLLLDVLQPQHTGSWLNRRQIDGSLNRTSLGFYDRVWQILERTPNGIMVAGTHLPQQPTLSDMTMYEMNFSLLVEETLKNIVLPEYRQIIVELLMVVSIVLERNPELEFGDKVDLDSLVKEAFHDFQRDRICFEGKEKQQDNMEAFYNTPAVGKRGTSSYLTKAVMIQLLQGDVKPCKDDPCSVS
uniref:Phosphorylase b kinase regulatory subunit n=1 Tax=Seriola lalandi dorsalis TaxID=1841481 RepID=A0A3B4Y4P6_SERLL